MSVASVFSSALFSCCYSGKKRQGNFDMRVIISEMELFYSIFSDERVVHIFDSPVIILSKKLLFLDRVLSQLQFKISSVMRVFVTVLIQRRVIGFFPKIFEDFIRKANKWYSTIEVDLCLAISISERLENQLKDALSLFFDAQVILRKSIDPNLLLGFVARTENETLDYSVRASLENICEAMRRN